MSSPGSAGKPPPVPDRDGGAAPLRVLVVAAYPAVRAGLATLLSQAPGSDLLPVDLGSRGGARGASWTGGPGGDRLAAFAEPDADVILTDVAGLPDDRLDQLADAHPGAPFVLLGANPATDGPGLAAGPVAYLSPDADGPTLAAAVRGVALGLTVLDPGLALAAGIHAHPAESPRPLGADDRETLTAREREVLRLVADGLPNKAIARALGISEHTAKFHVGSLLSKLGAGSRTEAVTLATRRGLLAI